MQAPCSPAGARGQKGATPSPAPLRSTKGYLLCAGICRLASNPVAEVREAIQRYCDVDVTFDGSREEGLLRALADALEHRDADEFTLAVQEFDSMTRLDTWKTTILVRAREVWGNRLHGGASRRGAACRLGLGL